MSGVLLLDIALVIVICLFFGQWFYNVYKSVKNRMYFEEYTKYLIRLDDDFSKTKGTIETEIWYDEFIFKYFSHKVQTEYISFRDYKSEVEDIELFIDWYTPKSSILNGVIKQKKRMNRIKELLD